MPLRQTCRRLYPPFRLQDSVAAGGANRRATESRATPVACGECCCQPLPVLRYTLPWASVPALRRAVELTEVKVQRRPRAHACAP